MKDYLEALNWRYATKKFDPAKKLSQDQLDQLLEAGRMSASSYGLQPYRILVVQDEKVRQRLKEVSWGQSQVTDASHLIILAHKTMVDDAMVDDFMGLTSEIRGIPLSDLEQYGGFMKKTLGAWSEEQKSIWTSKQTYIVLGNLLTAAALMGIDSCPMEGFERDKVDEILDLKSKGLGSSVLLTVGYRAEDDGYQHLTKVRRSAEELIHVI